MCTFSYLYVLKKINGTPNLSNHSNLMHDFKIWTQTICYYIILQPYCLKTELPSFEINKKSYVFLYKYCIDHGKYDAVCTVPTINSKPRQLNTQPDSHYIRYTAVSVLRSTTLSTPEGHWLTCAW